MNASSHSEVKAQLARQLSLTQQQNRRLARKIHDEISQKMTLLSLQLSLAATEEAPPANWAAGCQKWADIVTEVGQAIREISAELQPRIINEFGLTAALRWFAQSTKQITCAFAQPKEQIAVDVVTANELFSICREFALETLVSSGIPRVEIELEQREGIVVLAFRANDNEPGRELLTEQRLEPIALRERLQFLDGAAELSRSIEGGAVLTLSVPSVRAPDLH
jgi:signal transduction histidine kinase